MPKIRPITDLRNTNEISEICHSQSEPVFITKNGYGDLVIMSIETYERMIDTAATDQAIREAEAEYASNGVLITQLSCSPTINSSCTSLSQTMIAAAF